METPKPKKKMHPNSLANLRPITAENQPAGRGRRKGSRNRATIIKQWMNTKIEIDNPENPNAGEKVTVTLYDAAALGLFEAAIGGSVAAFQEIQNTLFGKLADKQELTGKDGGPITVKDIQKMSDEELAAIVQNNE